MYTLREIKNERGYVRDFHIMHNDKFVLSLAEDVMGQELDALKLITHLLDSQDQEIERLKTRLEKHYGY